MPITIIVEDGSLVINANSFLSLVELDSFLADRGLTLSVGNDDEKRKALLIRAKDYLESFAEQYKGYRTSATQALQWPRTGVYLYDVLLGSNTIPKELKNAQAQTVIAIDNGKINDISETVSSSGVAERKVGPIVTKYFNSGSAISSSSEYSTLVNNWLEPLLKTGIGGIFQRV